MDVFDELVAFAQKKKNMFLQKLLDIQAIENQQKIDVEQDDDNDFIYQAATFGSEWPNFTHLPSQNQGKINIIDVSNYQGRNDLLAATLAKKRQVIQQRMKNLKNYVDEQDLNCKIGRIIRYQTVSQQNQSLKDLYFDFDPSQQPRKIKLNIDEKNDEVYLFSGQIVAAVIENMTDKDIEIQKLLNFDYQEEIIQDDLSKYDFKSQSRKDSIVTVIAAGPFEREDRFGYKNFLTFIDKIKKNQISCDVLILLGPIVDSKFQKEVDKYNFEYEEFLENILQAISEELKKVKIIFVNSTREINSIFPVPQPPLDLKLTIFQNNKRIQLENVKQVGNPCILEIDEMRVGIINEDVLSEINSNSQRAGVQSSNKIDLALKQIVEQRNFVPVFPTKFSTDQSKSDLLDFTDQCPDVIISPSNFAQSARKINQTLFINPHYFSVANQYAILTYNGNNSLQIINKLRVDFEKL